MFRAGGAAADQDICDGDMTHSEAAEPLAKKRVAFKDDIVDEGQIGGQRIACPLNPSRSLSASTQSSQDDDQPPETYQPPRHTPPPRSNRFAPRGRPGGVPGKRPQAR